MKRNESLSSYCERAFTLKVNKKLLQQHVSGSARKVITLKDISNIQGRLHEKSERNDLDVLLQKLKSVEGKVIYLLNTDVRVSTTLL